MPTVTGGHLVPSLHPDVSRGPGQLLVPDPTSYEVLRSSPIATAISPVR
jgi:hypothetical protein